MRFTAKEDIDATAAYVFEAFSDFDAFETRARRHGVTVLRHGAPDGGNMSWEAQFRFRGRSRDLDLALFNYVPHELIDLEAVSRSLVATFKLTFEAFTPTRTRVSLELELKPQALQARVFIHSLKLAKNRLTKRLRLRMADFSKEVERQYLDDQAA